MEIRRAGTGADQPGNPDYFTGSVSIRPLFAATAPARAHGAEVTFAPGARTAWHTHPLGQTLVITTGTGRVQRDGGLVETVGPGDIISFAPGEKHWHGAAPDSSMTHFAVHEALDGKTVDWLEPVSDAQYSGQTG